MRPEVKKYIVDNGVTTYTMSADKFTTPEVWSDIQDNGATILVGWPGGIAISEDKIKAASDLRIAKEYATLHLNHRTFVVQKNIPWRNDVDMFVIRLRQAGILDIKFFSVSF